MTSTFVKRLLPLYTLDGADPALDYTYRWWRSRRDGGLLPCRAEVDSWAFRLLVGGAAWIEVRSPEPADWQLAPLGAWLGKLAARGEAEATLRVDLQTVRLTGVVRLQDLIVTGRRIGWRQLVLPHADDGVQVRDLLVIHVALPPAAMAGRGAPSSGRRR
jgi:hypothetical protein